ncbi:unnamed protein product [Protopolystoma xenopodis]|uniref:Uncharacterized protein n=1 Tax=Protopolystoma xenopodis TaxID=117903 RepID=A0A3S5AES8_9PLAT|nr:unnamed protein product [Protopolystoma xenopodis]
MNTPPARPKKSQRSDPQTVRKAACFSTFLSNSVSTVLSACLPIRTSKSSSPTSSSPSTKQKRMGIAMIHCLAD